MSSSAAKLEPVAVHMDLDDTFLRLRLADGRELAVPLAWYSKLSIRGMLIGNTAA